MSHEQLVERDKEMIPTVLLRAMLALVLLCLALVAFATLTDRPLEATPPQLDVAKELQIMIFASMSGAAKVMDTNGTVIADLAPEQGGFIAGVGRVLERERGKIGAEGSAPVRLIQYSNGNLALRDDLTGWRAELMGFGMDNAAAFHRLLQN